jgi:hypothetical protein
MPRVLCSLPNASTLINGVRFASVPDGMLSEEISDEAAAAFAAIRGYVVTDKRGKPISLSDAPAPPATR